MLTDKTAAMPSKKGSKFAIFKLTDLVKYDLDKVKKYLDSQGDKEEAKLALKSFTPNGYKQMSVMAFGTEIALSMQNIKAGCIVMVINPKLMKSNGDSDKNGITFCIDSEAQVEIIGYSEDYNVCNGRS